MHLFQEFFWNLVNLLSLLSAYLPTDCVLTWLQVQYENLFARSEKRLKEKRTR